MSDLQLSRKDAAAVKVLLDPAEEADCDFLVPAALLQQFGVVRMIL